MADREVLVKIVCHGDAVAQRLDEDPGALRALGMALSQRLGYPSRANHIEIVPVYEPAMK